METINWPDKQPGYYVARHNAKGDLTGYLTPEGGFSMRRRLADRWESASGAALAAGLKTRSFTVLANNIEFHNGSRGNV
jgi:hypothetical protein